MLIYLATPVTVGDSVQNLRNPCLVAARLEAAGISVHNPRLYNTQYAIAGPSDYDVVMERCLRMIDHCDAVLRIPGPSTGADREVAYAAENGKPVFFDESNLIAWHRAETLAVTNGVWTDDDDVDPDHLAVDDDMVKDLADSGFADTDVIDPDIQD